MGRYELYAIYCVIHARGRKSPNQLFKVLITTFRTKEKGSKNLILNNNRKGVHCKKPRTMETKTKKSKRSITLALSGET